MSLSIILLAGFLLFALVFIVLLRQRNMLNWFGSYLRGALTPSRLPSDTKHVVFCFVDHFEPMWHRPSYEVECERVSRWCKEYRAMAARHVDADGTYPQHSFFYPEEEYRVEHLEPLAQLCADGFGELEVHLHHDDDTEAGLREKLARFVKTLRDGHGALPTHPENGQPAFAFIHGNWCLDNSRDDGQWCGVNNELIILNEMNCYADFTLPAAPDTSQTKKINSIYYAKDDPLKPKSHDTGVDVRVGGTPEGDLMIIQGPLTLDWRNRKWGILPRIENADIRAGQPPTSERVDSWINTHIHVEGRPEWVFVKIHTHGTQDGDIDTLLGEPVDEMFTYLEQAYNDGDDYVLHYVSAREMYNIAKAAEAGSTGNPNDYRDFLLPRPPHCQPAE